MKKPVLITTEFRGVFFGYLEEMTSEREVVLINARNCVYWSSDCKGFLGLASTGPTNSCKVGPQVKSIRLYGVTSITDVEREAVKQWESAPWG